MIWSTTFPTRTDVFSAKTSQSAHPRSLIRVSEGTLASQSSTWSSGGQRRMIKMCGCAGWSESCKKHSARLIKKTVKCWKSAVYRSLHDPVFIIVWKYKGSHYTDLLTWCCRLFARTCGHIGCQFVHLYVAMVFWQIMYLVYYLV